MYDTHELAWAAGFYDGEGCMTRARTQPKPRTTFLPTICIGQRDRAVLDRFHHAVLGVGRVDGPYPYVTRVSGIEREMYQYRAGTFEHAQAVIALLWKWLSPLKREQARTILLEYQGQQSHRVARGPTGRPMLAPPGRPRGIPGHRPTNPRGEHGRFARAG